MAGGAHRIVTVARLLDACEVAGVTIHLTGETIDRVDIHVRRPAGDSAPFDWLVAALVPKGDLNRCVTN